MIAANKKFQIMYLALLIIVGICYCYYFSIKTSNSEKTQLTNEIVVEKPSYHESQDNYQRQMMRKERLRHLYGHPCPNYMLETKVDSQAVKVNKP
jgi:hypothetical protein